MQTPGTGTNVATDGAPLECREISFHYDAQRPLLRDVSLQARRGEIVGIIGPNGAGKSTLLRVLTGRLSPQHGQVLLGGRNISTLSRREIAGHVAYVPQKSSPAFAFTVSDIVFMGRHPYSGLSVLDTEEDSMIVEQALDRAGISHLRNKPFDEISGGEQQLVLIARALAQQSPIMLLDEPMTFLDIRRQAEIIRLIRGQRAEGKAIIIVIHDLNVAATMCDRLLLMSAGEITALGAPSDVLTQAHLSSAFQIPVTVEQTSAGAITVSPGLD